MLTLILLLAVAASASAAVRCVGSSGGDCASSHPTIADAVGAATDGVDTVRIAAGTYDEAIDTPKVLTFEGAGSGTLDDSSGATVVHPSLTADARNAFTLPNGGTLRDLRADGSESPGNGCTCDGGRGVDFSPQTSGDHHLDLSQVVAVGRSGGAAVLAGGQNDREVDLTIDRSTLRGGGGFDLTDAVVISGRGQSTIRRSTLVSQTGATDNLRLNGGQDLLLEDSTVDGTQRAVTVDAANLTARRSRLLGLTGLQVGWLTGEGSASVSDSLVLGRRLGGFRYERHAAAEVAGDASLVATGTTFVAFPPSVPNTGPGPFAAVRTRILSSSSERPRATLRNSIARLINPEGNDADLNAAGGTIGADHTSFTSWRTSNGGSVPAPGSTHNVPGDPLFTDPAAEDFTVKRCSPVIDRGDASLAGAGALDLAGHPRSLDGNGDGTPAPDLGAFERTDVSTGCGASPPASGPTQPAGPGGTNAAPALSDLRLTRTVFAPFPKRGRRPHRGTRFRFHLSERATVKITFHRILGGRRARIAGRRRCVHPRRSRSGRRCERFLRFGWMKSTEAAGDQSILFRGRLKNVVLKPGRWQATVMAFDGQGAHSKAKRLRFRVVRP